MKKSLETFTVNNQIIERLYSFELTQPGVLTEELFFLSYAQRYILKGQDSRINAINDFSFYALPADTQEAIRQTYTIELVSDTEGTLPESKETSLISVKDVDILSTIKRYDKQMVHAIDLVAGTYADLTPRRVNIYTQKLFEANKLSSDTSDPINPMQYPYLMAEVLGGRASDLNLAAQAVMQTAMRWMAIDSTLEGLHILWRQTCSKQAEGQPVLTLSNISSVYNEIFNAVQTASERLMNNDTPMDIISDASLAVQNILTGPGE